MSASRVFRTADFLQPAEGEPIRSVITESDDAAVVAWHVKPGQRISAHVHPSGQDTWVILSGRGDYQLDVQGRTASVAPGDVVVAHRGEVHGVFNPGPEPLIFVSVVCPALSGFEPVSGSGAR
jgi:quercetin dioxygenase-like cupin family protein